MSNIAELGVVKLHSSLLTGGCHHVTGITNHWHCHPSKELGVSKSTVLAGTIN